jgi:hypothetical protein
MAVTNIVAADADTTANELSRSVGTELLRILKGKPRQGITSETSKWLRRKFPTFRVRDSSAEEC